MSGEPRRRERPSQHGGRGEPSADASQVAGQDAGALSLIRASPGHVVTALAGIREPIVVILLLIAFFTSISGKPLDGLLMLLAAVSLAWDAGHRARHPRPPGNGAADGEPASTGPASTGPASTGPASTRPATGGAGVGGIGMGAAAVAGAAPEPGQLPAAERWRRPLLTLAWVLGGACYVVVVGSFSRYSWPATVAVVGLGMAVVISGWQRPRRARPAPDPVLAGTVPRRGLALWGAVLVAGGLWELGSLLQQPTLTTSSYAHPTISTLTDPVLSAWPGRSVVLAGWLLLGWFLVER